MNWTHIMIHHSFTEDNQTVSWPAIRKYHTQTNKWNDIGYHFGVEWAGLEYEAVVGRSLLLPGAHCKEGGMNQKAIGICVVGNFDLTPPPPKALYVLVNRLLIPLMGVFNIPSKNIVFHNEYAPYKTCPGKLFTKDAIYNLLPGVIT